MSPKRAPSSITNANVNITVTSLVISPPILGNEDSKEEEKLLHFLSTSLVPYTVFHLPMSALGHVLSPLSHLCLRRYVSKPALLSLLLVSLNNSLLLMNENKPKIKGVAISHMSLLK